jgi:hypothetical protein
MSSLIRPVVLAAILTVALPATRAAADAPASPDADVKVTVLTLAEPDVPAELVSSVERRLLLGLKKKPGLKVKSLATLLAEFSDRPGSKGVGKVDRVLEKAADDISETRGAWYRVKQLKAAVSTLERKLEVVSKRKLAWAQFLLARTLMTVRQWKMARAVLVELFGWRMSFKTPRHLCRSRCLKLVLGARRRARQLPTGELSVESSPSHAKVYLDGRYQGLTPTVVTASRGRHYVTVRRSGYLKQVVAKDVEPDERATVRVALPKSSEALILEQSLARIRRTVGKRRASPSIRQLRSFLLLDQVVLVTFAPAGGSRYRMRCFVYDLRTGLLLNELARTISTDEVAPADKWAGLAYSGVRLDGSLPDPGEEPLGSSGDDGARPLYEKWWFWTAVAVGVASIAVPLGMGLANRNSGPPAVPKGYSSVTIGF